MAFEAETHSILVRVEPCYLTQESEPEENRYLWAYTINIENRAGEEVQLIARHWRITDGTGRCQEVRGPGVVGKQPRLKHGETFRYTSSCPLSTPYGIMVGAYQMIRTRNGEMFEIDIPAFALDSPHETRRAN
ncbi:MAG: Co2+/Mg2+ efflux protein ApaG [Hyphomonadaceae bacterium]